MAYNRKSFQQRANSYLAEEDRGLSYTTSYAQQIKPQYQRGRYGSNQKKYDYQSQINDSRDVRPRTPSAGQFNKYKYEQQFLNPSQPDYTNTVSHSKLKKIAKNYATGIGNTNFSDLNIHDKGQSKNKYINIKDQSVPEIEIQRKQNVNTRNIQNNRKIYEQRKQISIPNQHQKQRSFSKKYNETQIIKDNFQKISEEKILQKINRINKLNSQINGRLQKILAKVSQ